MDVRVWSTHRPISIGTYPKGYGAVNIVNFDRRVEVPEIGGRLAYGYIDFECDLPEDEQRHYDLIPAVRPKDPRLDGAARAIAKALNAGDEEKAEKLADKAIRLGVAESYEELLSQAIRYME